MKINVTWKDILHGDPGNPTGCMVALAVERATGYKPTVGFSLITSTGRLGYLEGAVAAKIRQFDKFGFTLPFSFNLEWADVMAQKKPKVLAFQQLPARMVQRPAIVRAAEIAA